jgi:N-acetylglucosaminyldiphosphoundecaprenol N-acetyl-beta-D-mannosaminyltransferase
MTNKAAATVPTYSLLGVRVHGFELESLNRHMERLVRSGGRAAIGHHNLHSVYLHRRSAAMRRFYDRADAAFIDGMGLVFAGRLLGLPLRRENRITYVDWIGPLLELARDQGWRVYYLGSAPDVVEIGAGILRSRYPGLDLTVRHGYFENDPASSENGAVLAEINACRPDLLLVGMGMPRQEEWILENLDRLDARVVLSSGGCMDYLAGVVPTPPRQMAKLGLEWLFRLMADPRRLARRCLWEPWFILPSFAREFFEHRVLRRPRLDGAGDGRG